MVVLAAAASVVALAQGEPTGRTREDTDVYAAPSSESEIIGTVLPYALVIIEGRSETGAWLLIRTPYDALRGWVRTNALTLGEEVGDVASLPVTYDSQSTAGDDGLRLYAGPGTSYEMVGTLPGDARVEVEGRNFTGTWLLVQTDEVERGWIEAQYIALEGVLEVRDLPVVSAQPTPSAAPPPTSTPLPVSIGEAALPLYAGPGETHERTGAIVPGTPLSIEGRDASSAWLRVYTEGEGAVRGWLAVQAVTLEEDTDMAALPVVGQPPPPLDLTPPPPNPYDDPRAARLYAAPALPERVSPRMQEVFLLGLSRGMNPHVFANVGDCQMARWDFLEFIGEDVQSAPHLQDTLNYFAAPLDSGADVSAFDRLGAATRNGFTTAMVLDPAFAPPSCEDGESPLMCEYRILQPSVSLIMLGQADMQVYDAATFAQYMRQIIQETIDQGIIPVLINFPADPSYAWWDITLDYNVAMLTIAEEMQVPYINLWLATRALANQGIDSSGWHLSDQGGYRIRNLLIVQMLSIIWHTR